MRLFLSVSALSLSSSAITVATGVLFSYDSASEVGPDHWGDLPIAGNECYGRKNSPIAVTSCECQIFADYQLDGGTCDFETLDFGLTNNGVKATYPRRGCIRPRMQIPGLEGTYEALEFRIHTSSEHTIDEKFFGGELQVLHQQVGGDQFAVFGFMVQSGAPHDHPTFETLLEGWNFAELRTITDCLSSGRRVAEVGNSTEGTRKLHGFNVYDFVPDHVSFYHYEGSLTTPPCSETVWWNLADTPLSISTRQFNKLVDLTLNYIDGTSCQLGTVASPSGSTSRPVQSLNGRAVSRVCPSFVAILDERPTRSQESNESGKEKRGKKEKEGKRKGKKTGRLKGGSEKAAIVYFDEWD